MHYMHTNTYTTHIYINTCMHNSEVNASDVRRKTSPTKTGLIWCYRQSREDPRKARMRGTKGERWFQVRHINYSQDVVRCKCNTNWTGPLIIIHWGHLLAYLTNPPKLLFASDQKTFGLTFDVVCRHDKNHEPRY